MEENKEEKVYLDLKKVPLESEKQEKKKKRQRIALNFSICFFFIILGFVSGIYFEKALHPVNDADPTNTFGEIQAVLESTYLYKNDFEDINTELIDKAFYGMTNFKDDPYTSYMSKAEIDSFANSINMDYVGIGVVYSLQDGFGVVQRVLINSPAERAGILAGDIITSVDGVSVEGLSTDEIKQMVIGEINTEVKIGIMRDGKAMNIVVIRGEVDNSAYAYTQDDYVVLNIYSFGESTARECISYLSQYTDYHKIIIDIRNNSGGYQTAISEIAGLFIGNDEVYLIQTDAYGHETKALTSCSVTYRNFDNIVVLINENTASAAEVFAISLSEQLDYVTLVGTTTYGKGVIQSTHYLANGGALKYTTYNWASPNGVSINKVGVKPDEEVRMADIYYTTYVSMADDTIYKYDSVSEVNGVCQLALDYLGYDVDRTDGYFSRTTQKAIYGFKIDNGLNADGLLDKTTYDKIISVTLSNIYSGVNDYQMQRAVQLMQK